MVRNYMTRAGLGAMALAASFALTSATTPAQSAMDFFKGKKISVMVPFGPGGGYDTYARLMAPYFSKYLDATFVVQNKPGAGGLLGLGQIYTANADGTELIFFQGTGAAAAQIVGTKNVRYDLLKMSHIATVAYSPWVVLVQPKSPFNTVADLKSSKNQIIWAGTGPMASGSTGARFLCTALELNCRVVLGYKGSKSSVLALARKEVDAYYVSDSSADKYVAGGSAKALMTTTKSKSRFFPKLNSIYKVANLSAKDKWLVEYHNKLEALGRLLSGPPGIPADRLEVLRKMAKDILTDPKFVAAAEKKRRYILYSNAADTMAALKGVLEISADEKNRVLPLLQGK